MINRFVECILLMAWMTNYLNDKETSFPSIHWNNYDENVIMSTCMDRSIFECNVCDNINFPIP